MDNQKYSLLIEQLSNINKSLNTHNRIMSVFLKFALDSSSFKSKTTEDIKATAQKENEILKTIKEYTNLYDTYNLYYRYANCFIRFHTFFIS